MIKKLNLLKNFVSIAGRVQEPKKFAEKLKSIPEGWELLKTSNDIEATKAYAYKAAVFINRETKELLFANSGTDVKSPNDLRDDAKLIWHNVPNKLSSIKALIREVKEELGAENISGYKVESAGHSLGAVLSDLCGLELKAQGFSNGDKKIKSTTFDSPGSKAIVEQALAEDEFSYTMVSDDIGYDVYNARPNFINSLNQQSGGVHLSVAKKDASDVAPVKGGWFAYFGGKLAQATGLDKISKSVYEHKQIMKDQDSVSVKIEQWAPTLFNKASLYLPFGPKSQETQKVVLAYDKKIMESEASDSDGAYTMFADYDDEDFGILINAKSFALKTLAKIVHGPDYLIQEDEYPLGEATTLPDYF